MSKPKKDLAQMTPIEIIKSKKMKAVNRFYFYEFITKLITIVVIVFLMLQFVFGFKLMPNIDMTPRISAADLLVYYRLDKEPIAGDVIVFKHEEQEYVLRVVAKGGDEVNISENGLIINGAIQGASNIFYSTGVYEEGISFPVKLEEDEFFVLGDLREGAMDSRYFGPIKLGDIKGKVFVLLRRTQF